MPLEPNQKAAQVQESDFAAIHNGLLYEANLMCHAEGVRRLSGGRGGRDCGKCEPCLARKGMKALARVEKAVRRG